MNSNKFKIIGVFIMVFGITLTLTACELDEIIGDDPEPDPDPDTYSLTIEMLGEGEILDEDDNVILSEDGETKEFTLVAGEVFKLHLSPDEGRMSTYDGDFEFKEEEQILIVEADEDKTGKIFFSLENKVVSYQDLTFNPVKFEDDAGINPFMKPQIREAINWLIDREHLINEFYDEELNAVPRYIPSSKFTDYEEYPNLKDKRLELEDKYGHDNDKAEEIIENEMEKLGAEKEGGTWHYDDEPVILTFLIRDDDPDNMRENIGDYLASKLDDLGFEVERKKGDMQELGEIWIGEDPEKGGWHIYTGGWISHALFIEENRPLSAIYRDNHIPHHYTEGHDEDVLLYNKYEPLPELSEYGDKISNREWSTLEDRAEILGEAWELALKDSFRIWLGEYIFIEE